MSTTPRPRKEPQRADAPGEGAYPRLGESVLERQLVGKLERPVLDRLHPSQGEEHQDRLLEPFVDDDLVGRAVDFGNPCLAGVEQVDGLFDQRCRVGVRGREIVPPLPELFDTRPQISHAAP